MPSWVVRALVTLAAGTAMTGFLPPHVGAAGAPRYHKPPPPAPPPELDRLRQLRDDDRFRGAIEWSASTRTEAENWQGDPLRYHDQGSAGLSDVTFHGPDKRCLEVLPGEARPGGRVTVAPCSGLETQIFRADHRAPHGTQIRTKRGGVRTGSPPPETPDGHPLCLEHFQDAGERELRLAPCHDLYFETDVGPVADPQRWIWMFPTGPAPLDLSPILIPTQIRTHDALCVAPGISRPGITAAILVGCPPSFSGRSASTWVLMERR